MNPVLGMLLVLVVLAACFLGLRLLQQRASPHPEILRKLMHVLMGLVASTFPWLFDAAWPVLLLAGGSLVVLVVVRSGRGMTRDLRGVLHGVQRSSWGELLFPVAIALLFVLADGNALLYVVPILILTLADAVAALIGVYYGQLQFSTLEGSKSLEGSFAFFIVTFLCVHVAVLLFTDAGRLESLLIGVLMGVIVMMFEAVAWRGLDNLFIPVASLALLETYLALDAPALTLRLAVILLLLAFLLVWRRRSTLDDSALIGAGLVAYAAWAIGDVYWLLVPVLMFVGATLLALRDVPERRRNLHTVYALLAISGPGLGWLVLHNTTGTPGLYLAYAISFGAHLAMLGVSRAHFGREQLPVWRLGTAVLQGWLVVMLALSLYQGLSPGLWWPAAVAALGMLAAALAFYRWQPELSACPVTPLRWGRQATIAASVSVLGWLSLTGTSGSGA